MLKELYKYCTTQTSLHARQHGYLAESIAIESRYQRCKEAWRPHLDHSKSAIIQAAKNCKTRRSVLILGSGPLLDVPLFELAHLFDNVILADIVHPKRAKKLAAAHLNVTLVEHDITELNYPIDSSSIPVPSFMLGEPTIDLVVSANMLSQLALLPKDQLAKHQHITDIIDEFCRQIVTNHLDYLNKFNGSTLLITDHTRVQSDLHGNAIVGENAVFDVPLPDPTDQWIWNIAPAPELSDDYSYHHCMMSYLR